MGKTKLNIGSGVRPMNKPDNEWLDLDSRSVIPLFNHTSYKPDIVADCRKIPVEDERFNELLAHSILEHFNKDSISDCLKEWRRILIKGGKIVISVPDMVLLARKIIKANHKEDKKSLYEAVNLTYGEQDYAENQHKWGFTFNTLKEELEKVGFTDIVRLQPVRYASELLVEAVKL